MLLTRKILKETLLFCNTCLIEESKAIKPREPIILKIMKMLRYENSNFFVKKLAKNVTKSVPSAKLTSSKRDSS
jgi:hypothetical protein